MLSTERTQFESELATLCAGLNVPMTGERIEAYWRGLGKMQMQSFTRVVEFCLSEAGPEKIPTAPQVWKLYKQLKSVRTTVTAKREEGPRDTLSEFGNRALLMFLMDPKRPKGASDASLKRMVDLKNRTIASYREILAVEQVSSQEMLAMLHKRFAEVYSHVPDAELEEIRHRYLRHGYCAAFTLTAQDAAA